MGGAEEVLEVLVGSTDVRLTVLVPVAVLTVTVGLPSPSPSPPSILKGSEYWKTAVSLSRMNLRP